MMTNTMAQVVVVGVDFGSAGDDAITQALTMLHNGAASVVRAVHVLDPRDVVEDPEKPAFSTEEEVLERAPQIMHARILQLARDAGLAVDQAKLHTHARIGRAVETIRQFAVDYNADLIIVGTHGRRGIDRLMLGSVAEALVRSARCPVLVARPKDYGGLKKTPLPDPPYKPGEAPQRSTVHDTPEHVTTERESWHPADNGPTGFRIV